MDVEPERLKLLAESAFLASICNDSARARTIAAGLAVAHRSEPAAGVANALADLTDRDYEAAIAHLRPLADAGDASGLTFLALAYRLAGRSADFEATKAKIHTDDPSLVDLAAALENVHPA